MTHNFEWSTFTIWLTTIIGGTVMTIFNLFIAYRDAKMNKIVEKAIEKIFEKVESTYVGKSYCDASHKLTDQNLMSIRDDIKDIKTSQESQYNELKDMLKILIQKAV